MNRLVYDISRWILWLARNTRGLDLAATTDSPRLHLEDELFQRLIDDIEALPNGEWHRQWGAWAAKIHDACSKMPTFQRLACECRGDPDAAAVALEELLRDLPPTLADEIPPDISLRRTLRAGTSRASAAVDDLRDAVLGLQHVQLGLGGDHDNQAGRERVTSLARRLRDDPRLIHVARLAGRFVRILEQKRRTRVRPGVDEVTDVIPGSDIQRLVPYALGRMVHPRTRLLALAELVEGRAMSYELTGAEQLGRGPAIVLVDKSSSMNEGGRDAWATAVGLALLAMAKKDRRTFALVPFNEATLGEFIVGPRDRLPEAALMIEPSGGTDISAALQRGLEIVERRADRLPGADLILITDGEADPARAHELRKRVEVLGLTVFGIAIEVPAASLEPWCDMVHGVGGGVVLENGLATTLATGATS